MDLGFKLLSGSVIIIILLGRTKVKNYLYAFIVLMLLSFLINGIVVFCAENLNNDIFISLNFQQYINISPVVLLGVTVLVYVCVRLIQKQMKLKNRDIRAELELHICGNKISCNALMDSGCSLNDPLSSSQVFVISQVKFENIKNLISQSEINKRSRVVPAITVGDSCLLHGIRCDGAILKYNHERYEFQKVVAVASKKEIGLNFEAIVSYDSVDRLSDRKCECSGV